MVTESVGFQALSIILAGLATISLFIRVITSKVDEDVRFVQAVGLCFFAGTTAILYTNLSKEAGGMALAFVGYTAVTTLLVLAIFWLIRTVRS